MIALLMMGGSGSAVGTMDLHTEFMNHQELTPHARARIIGDCLLNVLLREKTCSNSWQDCRRELLRSHGNHEAIAERKMCRSQYTVNDVSVVQNVNMDDVE